MQLMRSERWGSTYRNGLRFFVASLVSFFVGQGNAMAKPTYFSGPDIALQQAVDADDPAAIERALRAGADVNARERQVGGTILEYAVAQLRDEAIPVLLRHGADPSLRDRENANAVTTAADAWFKDHTPLRLLLDAGADPNTRDEMGEPILKSFLVQKQVDAVDLLAQHHVDLNARLAGFYDPKNLHPGPDNAKLPNGNPLILNQASSGDWDMVYKLLELGAEFDYPNAVSGMPRRYNPRYADIPGVGSPMYDYKVKCWKFMTERGLKLPPFAGMH